MIRHGLTTRLCVSSSIRFPRERLGQQSKGLMQGVQPVLLVRLKKRSMQAE